MTVSIKTGIEIDHMRTAGRLASEVLDMIEEHVVAGVTTDELNTICHDYIVNTSVNHVICHGIPGEKKLKKGDIINIDVTVIKDGFHGDNSRMYYVGKPSILAKRVSEVAKQAMLIGIDMVKPGIQLGDIGHAIQQHAEAANFTVVREYCGHGIGRVFHEEPQVLHYGRPNTGLALEQGMTFTIEPMINAGRKETKLLADNWTVVTRDHSLSAQWEHTILVTADGYEILTKSANAVLP